MKTYIEIWDAKEARQKLLRPGKLERQRGFTRGDYGGDDQRVKGGRLKWSVKTYDRKKKVKRISKFPRRETLRRRETSLTTLALRTHSLVGAIPCDLCYYLFIPLLLLVLRMLTL